MLYFHMQKSKPINWSQTLPHEERFSFQKVDKHQINGHKSEAYSTYNNTQRVPSKCTDGR